jgi:hypothetical protein
MLKTPGAGLRTVAGAAAHQDKALKNGREQQVRGKENDTKRLAYLYISVYLYA